MIIEDEITNLRWGQVEKRTLKIWFRKLYFCRGVMETMSWVLLGNFNAPFLVVFNKSNERGVETVCLFFHFLLAVAAYSWAQWRWGRTLGPWLRPHAHQRFQWLNMFGHRDSLTGQKQGNYRVWNQVMPRNALQINSLINIYIVI